MELKGPDTDYQCPGGIIGFDNCSNAGYGSAEIIRPASRALEENSLLVAAPGEQYPEGMAVNSAAKQGE